MPPALRLVSDPLSFDLGAQCATATEPARRFSAAWHRWRGDRLVPAKGDIRLDEIKSLLPMVMLAESRSADEFILRVVGSRYRDYFGVELTGLNYIEMAPPEGRERRRWRVAQQLELPCGSLYTYPHRFPSGRVELGEIIALPIAPDRPDGWPMMLAATFPLSTHLEDVPELPRPQLCPADQFAFVDIGAGIPDRTLP